MINSLNDFDKAFIKEVEFARLLKLLNPDCHVSVSIGNDYRWDIQCGNYTYELKTDYKSEETGNIAIEYRFKDKLSGAFKSEATYFVIELKTEYLIINRNEFVHWVVKNYRNFISTKGGDNNNSSLFLVKLKELKESNLKVQSLKKG